MPLAQDLLTDRQLDGTSPGRPCLPVARRRGRTPARPAPHRVPRQPQMTSALIGASPTGRPGPQPRGAGLPGAVTKASRPPGRGGGLPRCGSAVRRSG